MRLFRQLSHVDRSLVSNFRNIFVIRQKKNTDFWNILRVGEAMANKKRIQKFAKITCEIDGSFRFTALKYEQWIRTTRKKNKQSIILLKSNTFACQRISSNFVQFYKKHYKSVLFHRVDGVLLSALHNAAHCIWWNFASL